MVYGGDVNVFGGSVHSVKKNAEALVPARKEIELDVDAVKYNYMVMSRDQNAGRSHNINADNSSCGRVEEFEYLGTTLRTQSSVHEDSKGRLNSGNACYHSVHNLLSSSLQSKNIKL